MKLIDADTHVIEPEESMFKLLEPEFYPHRPVALFGPADTRMGPNNGSWLVEGKAFGGLGQGGFDLARSKLGQMNTTPVEAQTLEDVEARLTHMDRYGYDTQVLYPTLFLVSCISDVTLEAALFRAYNTYMAEACAKSHGRLKWVAPVPMRDPEAAVKEVRRASEIGAAGIFTLGVVHDITLSNPLFFATYQAASELDLPLCVHLGWGSPAILPKISGFFSGATVPVMWGFWSLLGEGVLGRFEKLRVGFIEAGASWVPCLIHQIRRHHEPPTTIWDDKFVPAKNVLTAYRDPVEWFKDGRAFVAFESGEDLPYLLSILGDDAMMFFTDYPHGDPSADENVPQKLQAMVGISDAAKEKLLGGNASRLYRL